MNLLAYRLISLPLIFSSVLSITTVAQDFEAVSRVSGGKPVAFMLTAYSTTLLANGNDHTRLRIAVTDSLSREITSADFTVRVYLEGDGVLKSAEGRVLNLLTDSAGKAYSESCLRHGTAELLFFAGTGPGKVKIEARSGNLWPGSHEIHMLPGDFRMMKPDQEQLTATNRPTGRMIGADISWLPQLEEEGTRFTDQGKETDAITLLRNHGMNCIRLRLFVNPENREGYSPGKVYCGLEQTLAMARRIKAAGMDLLLDFHYSDYWADPQQQYKPLAWKNLEFATLKDTVKAYTCRVLRALALQGTPPVMVQVGNEINHGMLWPDGHISHPEQLAALLKAGIQGVEDADPSLPVMMHIALGGQHDEAVFWLDNMIARGVTFDIIGLSYYPRWHGTLEDLRNNMDALVKRYRKPVNVVEYSDFKREVHEIVFSLPAGMGKGACIWEPLNRRSGLFDSGMNVTPLMRVYDQLSKTYLAEEPE